MKIKKIIILILCIGFIIIIPNWLISLYSNDEDNSPKLYSNIEEFEKETGVTVYNFYDLEEFVIYNRKTPLKSSPNYISISLDSNNEKEQNYRIENSKNGFHIYHMYNNSYKDDTKGMEKDILTTGTLYQEHFNDDGLGGRYFKGVFVKENFYYQVGFTNNDLDVSVLEQKMIAYIKLVEGIK